MTDWQSISGLFRRLDRELWVVTAADGQRRGGLVATFVNQASIVPEMPRVMLGVARQHQTWELIEASRAFALHLLRESQLDWVWRFGLQRGRTIDKLDGMQHCDSPHGPPVLTGAHGWLVCRVEDRLDAGDRTIYLAQVVDGQPPGDAPPLTLSRLLELAPDDKLAALRQQMQHDAAIDAEQIARWRASRQPQD